MRLRLSSKLVGTVMLQLFLVFIAVQVSTVAWREFSVFPPGAEGVFTQSPLIDIIRAVQYIGVTLLLVYLLQCKLLREPFHHLKLAARFRTFLSQGGLGFLIGAASVAVVMLVAMATGVVRFGGLAWKSGVEQGFWVLPVAGLFAHAAVGFSEELLFRGYLLNSLKRKTGVILAVILSSVLFSLLHFNGVNGLAAVAAINLFLVGVWFSLMFIYYRSIWVPIGAHFAWNWVQYHLLPVVRDGEFPGLLFFEPVRMVSSIFVGGAFDMEDTIWVTLVLLAVVIWYAMALRRQGQLTPTDQST